MNLSTPAQASTQANKVVVGHINDDASMQAVCDTLKVIHGDAYSFRVARWQGQISLAPSSGRHLFCFVMQAEDARVGLRPGQRVRGVPPVGPYRQFEPHGAEVTTAVKAELWPGDVLCATTDQPATANGSGVWFLVESEASDYPLPAAAFLRYLSDRPGGCAAYPGAFRREALPPVRATTGAPDQRGVNRVNEHTLDMRLDRIPQPQPHHHGPVAIGAGQVVNHSETALLLPRIRYGLPPFEGRANGAEDGQVVIYHDTTDPTTREVIPVRPGSVVVTPATTDGIAGHCFENAFAMLLAIPGFVSPHNAIA